MKLTRAKQHLLSGVRHSGQSLIGLLVVIGIIMVLAVAMLGHAWGKTA
jgi:hypothetical protein